VKDTLQETVDSIREELKGGYGGLWSIEHPDLRHPLVLRVSPDGCGPTGAAVWLVTLSCGGRVLYDTGLSRSVEPTEFASLLYVFLRAALNTVKAPPPKPS